MRHTAVILAFVVLLVFVALPASADTFGLGPTLGGKKARVAEKKPDVVYEPSVATTHATAEDTGVAEEPDATGPLPSNIAGLEGYSLWGRNAGAAAGVTFKRELGSTPIGDSRLRWRAGFIGGISTADDNSRLLYGGFIEAELDGLVGIILVARADDGVYLNPGLKVNLFSASF